MTQIMEAYWNLSSKRFIDNTCMTTDAEILGKLPACIQDEMYTMLRDNRKLEVRLRRTSVTLFLIILLISCEHNKINMLLDTVVDYNQ